MRSAVLIDTGSANLRSVATALRRVDLEPTAPTSPEQVVGADRVVLPGVGAFGAAMDALRDQDLVEALRERCVSGRPTLAVCVGMQVLAKASEENPGVEGLGILPAAVGRFRGALRVPHMGWNRVVAPSGVGWIETGYAYFANSYRINEDAAEHLRAEGWELAISDYEAGFIAAARRGGLLACQFHPELSGDWGRALLRAWADASSSEEVVSC